MRELSVTEIGPTETLREACAREIEWMARGHAAHEHVVLNEVADAIRKLPLRESPADMLQEAIAELTRQCRRHSRTYESCLGFGYDRLVAVDIDDPMKPFSDRSKWWPRVPVAA